MKFLSGYIFCAVLVLAQMLNQEGRVTSLPSQIEDNCSVGSFKICIKLSEIQSLSRTQDIEGIDSIKDSFAGKATVSSGGKSRIGKDEADVFAVKLDNGVVLLAMFDNEKQLNLDRSNIQLFEEGAAQICTVALRMAIENITPVKIENKNASSEE